MKSQRVRSGERAGHESGPSLPIYLFECFISKFCLTMLEKWGWTVLRKNNLWRVMVEMCGLKIAKHPFVRLPGHRLIINQVRPNNFSSRYSTADLYQWRALQGLINFISMIHQSLTAVLLVHKCGEWKLAFIGEDDAPKLSCIIL